MQGNRVTQGVVLIEIILHIALAAGILFVGSLLYVSIESMAGYRGARDAVERNATIVLLELTQRVRNAESVDDPTPGDEGEVLELQEEGTSISISLSGTELLLTEEAEVPIALTGSDVEVLDFTVTNNAPATSTDSISFELTLRSFNPGGRSIYNYEGTYRATATPR